MTADSLKNLGAKIIVQFMALAVAGIPIWIILLVKWLMEPEGFWQKIVLFGVGGYFLAGVQLVLVVILLIFSFHIWTED